jgi:UDP-glucose 4-epimerase
MKILVTGGAGFIGSNLVHKLAAKKENEIYCLDNFFTGRVSNLHPDVQYFAGDTKNIEDIIHFKPDIIYHLGEYSRISTSFEDIEKIWHFNIDGTFRVLQFCLKHDIKFIYAGSSSIFGNSGEDENLTPYSWTKSKIVELTKNYGEWYGLNYAIAYFYNIYGPGQISCGRYATVIGIFEEQFRAKAPLTVVAPGTQKRYFTHIEDAVEGLIKIGERGQGDGYYLCDESSLYSIEEVAQMFSNDIVYLPEQRGNRKVPAITDNRCSLELSWNAKNKLIDYITYLKRN